MLIPLHLCKINVNINIATIRIQIVRLCVTFVTYYHCNCLVHIIMVGICSSPHCLGQNITDSLCKLLTLVTFVNNFNVKPTNLNLDAMLHLARKSAFKCAPRIWHHRFPLILYIRPINTIETPSVLLLFENYSLKMQIVLNQ